MRLIEMWGFLTVEDVCLLMEYKSQNSAVWRLKRLVDVELVRREKSRLGGYIYCSQDFKRLDLAIYDHDQQVKRLAVAESKRLGCEYVTGRQLRSEARHVHGTAGITKKVPDFVLVQGEQRIAVEVELTQKSLKRQREIFDKYIEELGQRKYNRVFYYCGSGAVLGRVQQIVAEKKIQAINAALIPQTQDTAALAPAPKKAAPPPVLRTPEPALAQMPRPAQTQAVAIPVCPKCNYLAVYSSIAFCLCTSDAGKLTQYHMLNGQFNFPWGTFPADAPLGENVKDKREQ